MTIAGFDHVAIPTARPLELIAFYRALGFQVPERSDLENPLFPVFEIRFEGPSTGQR